jgi:hypothetical protein
MKISKEKDNSKTSIKHEPKEDTNPIMNNSQSKMTDSFCNLRDSQNIDMEQEELNLNNNNLKEEYDFYFKSHEKKEENSDEDNDLENFYENRQSRIEQEIMRRSSVNKSNSNLNSMRKDSSRVSLTSKLNTHRPSTPVVERNINVISQTKNFSNNKVNKLIQSATSFKSQVQMIDTKRNTVNVISYDEFKFKNISNRPSGTHTPLDTSRMSVSRDKNENLNKNNLNTRNMKRSTSEKKMNQNKNCNKNIHSNMNYKSSSHLNLTTLKNENKNLNQTTISKNKNTGNSVSKSKNYLNISNISYKNKNNQSSVSKSSNPKNINLKLKITHDTVEDITNTEESNYGLIASRKSKINHTNTKQSSKSKSRSKSKSDPHLTLHNNNINPVENHQNQKTLFERKGSLQVTNQQYINTFRKNTGNIGGSISSGININQEQSMGKGVNIVQTARKVNYTHNQPVMIQVIPPSSLNQKLENSENPMLTIGPNSNSNILISEAKTDFEKELIMLKTNNEKLDKEVKPLIEKHHRESSKKAITKIFELENNTSQTLPNEAITISDLQVDDNNHRTQSPHSRNENTHLKMNTDTLAHNSKSRSPSKRLSQMTLDNQSGSKESLTRKMTLQSEVLTKGHVDQNYEDEYKQIYVKRRATRTNTNNEERKQKFFDDLYHRNINWKKNIVDKFSSLKEEMAEEELKKCSFTPKLSRSSEKILSKSMTYANYDKEDFYNKNIKWKQQVEKFKQTQHLINERKEYEECFFQPVIKKTLLTETSDNTTKRDQDHIYKKNMEWLRKVNENKKLRDLEMKEEMKLKGRRESIRDRMARSRSMKNLQLQSSNTIQSDSNIINNSNYPFTEEKMKNDLFSSRSTLRLATSPKSLNTFRTDMMTSNVFSTNTKDSVEKDNFDKDIKELKYLITSLKTTLEENKYLYTSEDKSREETLQNRNFISINDSYNININIKSPSESMIKTFKKSSSTDRVSDNTCEGNIYIYIFFNFLIFS